MYRRSKKAWVPILEEEASSLGGGNCPGGFIGGNCHARRRVFSWSLWEDCPATRPSGSLWDASSKDFLQPHLPAIITSSSLTSLHVHRVIFNRLSRSTGSAQIEFNSCRQHETRHSISCLMRLERMLHY